MRSWYDELGSGSLCGVISGRDVGHSEANRPVGIGFFTKARL
jgi:hypothetical protein